MSDTGHNRDERVRRRAYELWEQAGQPDGRHKGFLHKAAANLMPHDGAVVDTGPKHLLPEIPPSNTDDTVNPRERAVKHRKKAEI